MPICVILIGSHVGHMNASPVAPPIVRKTPNPGRVLNEPSPMTAKFRAYDSYEDSFRDYARLITESPRYEKAQATAKNGSAVAYAAELQKAGYATDPEYARKLSGAINSALRVQRAQA